MDMEEIEIEEPGEQKEFEKLSEEEEISLKEFVKMALNSTEESSSEVSINNYDYFDTPLNNCTSFTLVCCLIFFFLALTTIGGVLNE